MTEIKRVLVVIEPEQEHQPALDRVLQLEKLVDFDIKLIACDYTQYLVEGYYFDAVDLPRLREEYLAERRQMLEGLAEPLREQGLQVETEAFWAHPSFETIVEEVYRFEADLVVLHARRHGAMSRMFLTNDDWQLVRCCPVPLLLVKEKAWHASPKILVGVDPVHHRHKPGGLDHKLIGVGQELAKLVDGEVHAVHSFNQIPLSGTYLKDAEVQHEAAMAGLMADFDLPAARQHVIDEAAEFAISKVEHDIDANIVVMGAISRSLIADVFIGNTTERVVDQVESDVLVIKPDDFVSPIQPS